jgi:hypothetical protein
MSLASPFLMFLAPLVAQAGPVSPAGDNDPITVSVAPDAPAGPKDASEPAAPLPPPPHSALFRFYDKNGDALLDAAETGRLPAPMREYLAAQKVDLTAGVNKEAFESHLPKMVEHLKSKTAEHVFPPAPLPMAPAAGGSSSGGGPSGRSSRGAGNRGSGDFRGLDLDQDSQVSFREWRAGKRLAHEFGPRDLNGDGMLTASEYDSTQALAGTIPAPSSGGGRPPGGGGPPAGNPMVTPPSAPSTTPPPMSPPAAAASGGSSPLGSTLSRQQFELLDRNKDGSVSPEELRNSRRIGPAFKQAGIDVEKPLSREAFYEAYAKAFPPRN